MGGSRVVVGAGGQAEGRPYLPLSHRQQAVLSTDDRDVHKPQDRSRRPLAAVWHPTNSD